jgi:DNA polymerase-3 subunit alpha
MIFNADISTMDLDCPSTWDLISAGNTKGCFQLESRLGRSIAKKLKPSNIEELAALISIMRPGCLEAIRDGKSVTNHYIDKKNGIEPTDYFHESLEPILKSTYGEMVYQEQAMEISRVIAGFNLQEADELRKSIGKKNVELMAKVKTKFLEGCKKIQKVSDQEAEQIFGWIEKSQRYSFNKSHAISYAMNCYLSAYAKAHYPRVFFASYLRFAKDKIDPQTEIKELVQNATEMNMVVCNPDIRMMNEFVELDKKCIYFGLTDIKGVGKSAFDKFKGIVEKSKLDLYNMTWIEYLYLLNQINTTASKALIQSGALDFLKMHRNQMLFEYNVFGELTAKESENLLKVLDIKKSLQKNFESLLATAKLSVKRQSTIANLIESLKKPPYSLEDTIEWLADTENMLIGCSISCSKVDMYDMTMVSSSCKDFKNDKCSSHSNIILAGEIEYIRTVKTKKGKDVGSEMAFVTLNDGTASLDSVVYFPEAYRKYRNQLFLGNIIIVKGNKSKDKDSLLVEKTFIPKT